MIAFRPAFARCTRALQHQQFRFLTSKKTPIAFVFDIDGVLVKGSKPIPQAKQALELLNSEKVPYILLTNGGGYTEQKRIDFLSEKIGLPLSPLQLVQSHTPMKALTKKYNRVLVVGGPDDLPRQCAKYYGFRDVIMPIDLVRQDPSIAPHHRFTDYELETFALQPSELNLDEPIEAVLMFSDPRDMGTDLQIILDVLNSQGGKIGTKRSIVGKDKGELSQPSIPVIFSNNDFLWANDYPLPRFGQGAVRMMTETLYAGQNKGAALTSTIMGKPFKVQYDYAHNVLIDWKNKVDHGKTQDLVQILPDLNVAPTSLPFEKIYMVGDNPASDIKGANDNGWESMLLRTGVFKDDDWDAAVAHPTAGLFDNVHEAVQSALKKNGYNGEK